MPTLTIENIVVPIQQGCKISNIAKELNISRDDIYTWLKYNNIDIHNLRFNKRYFAEINTEEKAYWLGFLCADGCISMTHCPKVDLGLSIIDIKHLEKWHKAINSGKKLYISEKYQTATSSHYSLEMCEDLIRLGCTPRKSLILKFPHISQDLIRHFIRGYFDGDGCISFHNKNTNTPQIRFTILGTINVLEGIKEFLNIHTKIYRKNKIYGLSVNGNKSAIKILDILYKDASIYLDRKYELYINHKLTLRK